MSHVTIKNSPQDDEYRLIDRAGPKIYSATKIFNDAAYVGTFPDRKLQQFANLLAETARGLQEASFIRRMPTVGLMMAEPDRYLFSVETAIQRYAQGAFTRDAYSCQDKVSTITPEGVIAAINYHLHKALQSRGCSMQDPAELTQNVFLVKTNQLKEQGTRVQLTDNVRAAIFSLLGQPESERFERALGYLANSVAMHTYNFDFTHFLRELRETFAAWPVDTDSPNEDFSQISTVNPTKLTEAVRTGITMR